MIVLCILGLFWLGVRVAALWRMCPATQQSAVRYDSGSWGRREPAHPAAEPEPDRTHHRAQGRPQDRMPDAPAAGPTTTQDAPEDIWAPTRAALVVLGRELTTALGVSAVRWAAAARPPSLPAEPEPAAVLPQEPSRPSFFAVPPPQHGPAYLGGREDGAFLRGWDDAVHWISHDHDAAPPTWGGVAYMTGWNHAVQAIEKARLGG